MRHSFFSGGEAPGDEAETADPQERSDSPRFVCFELYWKFSGGNLSGAGRLMDRPRYHSQSTTMIIS